MVEDGRGDGLSLRVAFHGFEDGYARVRGGMRRDLRMDAQTKDNGLAVGHARLRTRFERRWEAG